MKPNRNSTGRSSFLQIMVWLIFATAAGVLMVKQEVDVDLTAREIKKLEKEITELQINIVTSNIEIEALTTFPQVSELAMKMGLQSPVQKPKVINTNFIEMPREMQRVFKTADNADSTLMR